MSRGAGLATCDSHDTIVESEKVLFWQLAQVES